MTQRGYKTPTMADLQHSLATYVSDMLAVEEHIRIPFNTQANDSDLEQYPLAGPLVSRLVALTDTHIEALKSCLRDLGGHEISGAKTIVTNIEGWVASAIDKVRKTKVAKMLRDDYTALGLCTVSYSMLLATAQAYGNAQVAELADRHLRDYATCIMQIGDIMPEIVVRDLRETGVPVVDGGSTTMTRERISDAWRSSAQAQRQTHSGTIESDAAANRATSPSYPTV